MTKTKFLAKLLAMSQSEILGMVSPRTIRDIKTEDPNPRLLAFIVGQEGEATPNKVGLGPVLTTWYQSAIEALTAKLDLGTPIYHGHAGQAGQPGENRTPIGEVIGKLMRKIGDMFSTVALTYIYPQFQGIQYDVASIEATVNVPMDAKSFSVQGPDVEAITGIALGNSAIDKPAFAGATLIAQLQAFAGTPRTPKEGDEMLTLEQVKAAIQEGKFGPSDLFDAQALVKDPFIIEHVKAEKGSEYYARKRNQAEHDEKVKGLEAENANLKTQLAASAQAALKTRARESFDAVLSERPKLKEDERLTKFVRKQYDRAFQPTDEAKLKDDLNRFVDAQVSEYTDLFGAPKASGKTTPHGEPEAGGRPAPTPEDGQDNPLLDPKNNDLIPQD